MTQQAGPAAAHPKISVIIPVYNGGKDFVQCLRALAATTYPNYECIVVDDGSTDGSPAAAQAAGVRRLRLQGRFGPAYARNRGAEAAAGEILFFVDADVCVNPDTVGRVAQTLSAHPEIDALFGSYDDSPGAQNFMSQYKNLFHHFVHQTSSISATTFWSGCGAIRREVFRAMDGFDESYGRSSIEDIELGYRLKAAGHAIMLDKDIQVKHMKRWTLRGVVRSDIFDRGIPWTRLLLQDRGLPNDLNLKISQRISVLLSYLLLAMVGLVVLYFQGLALLPVVGLLAITMISYWYYDASARRRWLFLAGAVLLPLVCLAGLASSRHMLLLLPFITSLAVITVSYQFTGLQIGRRPQFLLLMGVCGLIPIIALFWRFPRWSVLPFLTAAALVLINFPFYRFFAQKRSWLFALRVLPFHLLYFLYSGIAFVCGVFVSVRGPARGDPAKGQATRIADRGLRMADPPMADGGWRMADCEMEKAPRKPHE